jgi:hypothetical protein
MGWSVRRAEAVRKTAVGFKVGLLITNGVGVGKLHPARRTIPAKHQINQ